MTLGQKIRQTRLARGLTQKELAGEQITRNMLSQIEHDAAQPSMRTLDYLAAALNVDAGWLLSGAPDGGAADTLARARALLREEQWQACLELLREGAAQAGDEALLILSRAAMRLAWAHLAREDYDGALALCGEALEYDARGLYTDAALRCAGLELRTRAALAQRQDAGEQAERYRRQHLQQQAEARYHLVMARYHLAQEHVQAAEKEIWSIGELPEAQQMEYLLLRGRIALRKEQFENALLYLQQAEQSGDTPRYLLRELYESLEQCCKEREDFKGAYEYATRLRALSESKQTL